MSDYPKISYTPDEGEEEVGGLKPGNLHWLTAHEMSGKSFVMQLEIMKARLQGKKVYIVDFEHPEGGYYV